MNRRANGFTLIEVLVALAIIAVAATAILRALDTAARATDRVRERAFAGWVAMNRITETRLLRAANPNESSTSGDSEMAGRRWAWEEKIEPSSFPRLYRIVVRVRAADSNDWIVERQGALGESLTRNGSGRDPFDNNAVSP